MKKKHRISKEVKEQILARIKQGEVSVVEAAREHGISDKTVYGWLASGIKGQPTLLEVAKLKKENRALKELIGEITMELNRAQKND